MLTSTTFRVLAIAVVCLVSSSGCSQSNNAALNAARAEAEAAKTELARRKGDADAARAEATAAKGELIKARADADAARAEAKAARAELAKLSKPAEGSDRRAAEWVHRIGGGLTVLLDGVPTEIKKDEELPEAGKPFRIIKVHLAANGLLRDEGLQHLKGLSVEYLDLHHNGGLVSDFRFVEGMKQLKELYLSGTVQGDDALKSLRNVPSLEILTLDDCRNVTDAGLLHLGELKGLKVLDLRKTGVTAEGIAKLQAALPNCKVSK